MNEIKDIILESFKYLKDNQIFAVVIFTLVVFGVISIIKNIKGNTNIKTGNYSPVIKGNNNSIKMNMNKREK